MTRFKKLLFSSLVVALLLCCIVGFGVRPVVAKADTEPYEPEPTETSEDEGIEPYGILTNLTLGLDGGNGEAWAYVKNNFTLFPATVRVIVELYSSETYQDSYKTMQLECRNMIPDLNINQIVEARVSTNGVSKYWRGRTYYKIDSKDWKEMETKTLLYDENGIYIM